MTKYTNISIVFQEVPDEITLAINLSNCPNKCVDCHSKFLWDDIGIELTTDGLDSLIKKNGENYITCVCFMGGDRNPNEINDFCKYIKTKYDLKTAWYSGKTHISDKIDLINFDYIKIGPYIEEKGGLTKSTTNQIFYKVNNNTLENINHRFTKRWL